MPRLRPLLTLCLAGAAIASSAPASAAEVRSFDPKVFAAAQARGRPILIDVHADWCPTCRAQAPVVSDIIRQPAYRKLVVFKLNFDDQEADWRRLNVYRQSTLIAFHGKVEKGRSVGDTDPNRLSRLIGSTLK
jgi:thioredoxin